MTKIPAKTPFLSAKMRHLEKEHPPNFFHVAKKWPKVNGKKNKNSKKFGPKGHASSMNKGSKNKKKYKKIQNAKKIPKRS